jgi:hypothetical protein
LCDHRGCIARQATRAAEIFKVLSAGSDHRMIRRKRRRRYGSRPAIERLGLARASRPLGDDSKVVQRVGQIRMERTQLFFLNARRAFQQLISRHQIASRRGTFRPIEHLPSVLMFGHRVSGFPMQSVAAKALVRNDATSALRESRAGATRGQSPGLTTCTADRQPCHERERQVHSSRRRSRNGQVVGGIDSRP